jgi:hypothetical protein
MIIKKYVVAAILSTSFFATSAELPPSQQPREQPMLTEKPTKQRVVDSVQQKEIEKIFVFPCEPWPMCA